MQLLKNLAYIALLLWGITSCSSTQTGFIQTKKTDGISYQQVVPETKSESKKTVVKSSRESKAVVTEAELDKVVKIYDIDIESSSDNENSMDFITRIISTAMRYQGTRYRLGGTSAAGFDCSGLMVKTFQEHDISLPRTSQEMSRLGVRLPNHEIKKGDLVFFKTRRGVISHVGLVTEVQGGNIKFIHSSTSSGVIISSLNEDYYRRTFSHASRIL